MPRFEVGRLRQLATDLFEWLGVPASDAGLAALALVDAELEAQPGHGLARLPFMVRKLKHRTIEPRPVMSIVSSRGSAALLDAGNGLGAVAAHRAMDIAIERARRFAIGACAVRNSNHLGAASFYVEQAAAAGMIGLAFSNSPPALAPPGGRKPFLGTNPIAAAFPTGSGTVVVDMATSQVARGRVLAARRRGESIPEGWALDADGRPTTDPVAAIEGSMVPLGGAKGFALALMVEAITGVLTAGGAGPEVGGTYVDADRPSRVSHLLVAMQPGEFAPGFADRMAGLAGAIRESEPIDAGRPVRVPGDRRHAERARALLEGVDLPDELVSELNGLTGEAGIASLA